MLQVVTVRHIAVGEPLTGLPSGLFTVAAQHPDLPGNKLAGTLILGVMPNGGRQLLYVPWSIDGLVYKQVFSGGEWKGWNAI